jgi:hypothetical protein
MRTNQPSAVREPGDVASYCPRHFDLSNKWIY